MHRRSGFTQYTFWKELAKFQYVMFFQDFRNNELLIDLVLDIDPEGMVLITHFSMGFVATNDYDNMLFLKILGLEEFDFKFKVLSSGFIDGVWKSDAIESIYGKTEWVNADVYKISRVSYIGKS